MKILMVHNRYQQAGGEDVIANQEAAILRDAGHHVVEYSRSNDEVKSYGSLRKYMLPMRLIWASDAVRDLRLLIHQERPVVAHFHNTFVMISPAAYYACQEQGVPVVQSLHNYRLLCPSADFFHDGKVCEICLGKKVPWPGVMRGCYHGMRSHTAAVATMLAVHHWLKTWNEKVNVYVVMTEFARQKFIQGDLPADRIVVKPNFIHPLPPVREGTGNYAIYVGRLAPEKRIATLLNTWKILKGVPLKIVGGGKGEEKIWPLLGSKKPDNIEMLGWLPREEIFALLRKARFLIFPSEWYEGFPMTILEAFASGVPVIASRLGAMLEIIEDGRTGLHFTAGNSNDLAAKVMWAWTHDKEMEVMGREARKEFEEKYTAEKNYRMLIDIYKHACE